MEISATAIGAPRIVVRLLGEKSGVGPVVVHEIVGRYWT